MLLSSTIYSLAILFNFSSSNLIFGTSLVVECVFEFTFSHHLNAFSFKSIKSLYFIPNLRFSLTYRTVLSTFPFVCPRYGLHYMGLNFKNPAKSSNSLSLIGFSGSPLGKSTCSSISIPFFRVLVTLAVCIFGN